MGNDRVTPGSQTSLREANRARIVSAVQQRGSLTQVELAGVTGLSPATVSNIVKELAIAGVLHTAPTSRSGRRAQQVTLARNLGLVAGMHFGTRSLRVALSDVAHRIVAEQRMPLPPDHRADQGLERAALLLTEMVDSLDAPLSEVLGIGVGVPAPVDVRTGQISSVGMLRGWEGAVVPDLLGARLGLPVSVDNDANLGGLAEARLGAARGRKNIVYIHASHAVGGALLVGGEVLHGRSGGAGEIGHAIVDESGPLCRCGHRGCLETYVGAPALLDLLRPSHGNLTLRGAVARAVAGDEGCQRVIAAAGHHVGVVAAGVCNLFDPEVLVIGGELADAGELFLGPIREVVEQRAIPSTAGPVPVVAAELGDAAEVRGALVIALERVTIGAPGKVLA